MAASTKKSMAGNKRKLGDLSMDEFMQGDFSSSSDEEVEMKTKQQKKQKKKQVTEKKVKGKKPKTEIQESEPSKKVKKGKKVKAEPKQVEKKHKSTKELLMEQDPEFLDFLEGEDQSLLQFDMSDMSGSSSDDDVEDAGQDVKENKKAKQQLVKDKKGKQNKQKTEVKKKKEELSKKSKGKAGKKIEKEVDEDDDEEEDVGEDDDDEEVDSEEESGEEDFDMDAFSDSDDEEMLHKPPAELEVMSGSDEEEGDDDDEDDDLEGGRKKKGKSKSVSVTMAMIEGWTNRFKTAPSPALIHEVIFAFKAAVQHTATKALVTKYKVQGAKVFNAVVRMCLVNIPASLQKILDLPQTTDLEKPVLPSTKNQKWKKVRVDVKSYLGDLIQLLKDLSEANMINVLLKHIHKLGAFFSCFPKITNVLIKRLISVWSDGEETSRVLAFLSINRMIRIQSDTLLESCIKQMYLAYVRNCKFTSPNALPQINFMQRSYVEILALDNSLAYQYAFVYIRQLAIHLRNALSTKKKESCQAVYNWQFIHCIGLWSRALSLMYPNDVMEPLIYPLVQVIIGTVKLVPTQKFYPLRFHCVKALTMISQATHTFIPVLPFILEVFELTDFNKKHRSISFRPFNFACILKFSKAQLQEKSFKDGVIDQLYELLLEHFHVHAHTIGYPELALPAVLQLKDFLKKCKVGNFTKQIRQILEKVEENCRFVTARRRSTNLALTDTKAIERWEYDCQTAGTPIGKFYATWRKLRDRELLHAIATREQSSTEDNVPEIKRNKTATEQEKKEFSALFDSDSDDDGGNFDLAESFLPPDEKKKLKKEREMKKKEVKKDTNKKGGDDDEDNEEDDGDYSDFDDDELDQLAGSGSDGSDVEYDDGVEHDDYDEDGEDEDAEVDEDEDGSDDDDEDDNEDDDDDDKEDVVKDFEFSSDGESD